MRLVKSFFSCFPLFTNNLYYLQFDLELEVDINIQLKLGLNLELELDFDQDLNLKLDQDLDKNLDISILPLIPTLNILNWPQIKTQEKKEEKTQIGQIKTYCGLNTIDI